MAGQSEPARPRTAAEIRKTLRQMSNPEHAADALRFFKPGNGQYGAGDHFLGIRAPVLRQFVRQCRGTDVRETFAVLKSKYHEERLFALFLLVQSFSRAEEPLRQTIFDGYLANTRYINNWDLVDSSAYFIVGPHLAGWSAARRRQLLSGLAKSANLWERRIAIIATLHFIRLHEFDDTLRIAKILLSDEQDLIHKATGWMLREVGNRNLAQEISFLDQHYKKMPRTMLRYAIEKFDKRDREAYLQGTR